MREKSDEAAVIGTQAKKLHRLLVEGPQEHSDVICLLRVGTDVRLSDDMAQEQELFIRKVALIQIHGKSR